jgi:FkbM family methyltransferase
VGAIDMPHARLLKLLQTSTPGHKPQLWEDVGFYLRHRLALSAAARLAPASLDQPRLVRLRRTDVQMEILPRRYIGQSIFLYGVWELIGSRLLDVLLEPGMCFVDVGANAGYYSLLAARLVGPGGTVHSFEPLDDLRAMLERSVRANAFSNVHVHPEAVTATSGSIAFYPYSETNEGVSSTIRHVDTQAEPRIVPAISLDDFTARHPHGRMDVIKIDVEGAEQQVFDGMARLLSSAQAPSAILFESTSASECAQQLREQGYDVAGLYYSLGRGLEFIDLGDQARIDRLMTNYAGQPTFDNLALRRTPGGLTFERLAARSRTRLSPVWRLLQRWT